LKTSSFDSENEDPKYMAEAVKRNKLPTPNKSNYLSPDNKM